MKLTIKLTNSWENMFETFSFCIEHANLYDLYQYIWDTPHFEVESEDYKCPPLVA